MGWRKVVFVPQTSLGNGQVLEACHLDLLTQVFFSFSLRHVRVHEVLIPYQKLLIEALDVSLSVSHTLPRFLNREFARIGFRLFRSPIIEILRIAFSHYVVDLVVVLDYTYKNYVTVLSRKTCLRESILPEKMEFCCSLTV